MKQFIFLPRWIRSLYHFLWAIIGPVWYQFPSRKLTVIGVTGTNGKTTTAELIATILEQAGYSTALVGTLRFKIAKSSTPNTRKMTMPGRMFLQKFFYQAVQAECEYAILEMTSEGALQYRHRGIDLDALIFLNLTPEHIDRHGSFSAYREAKCDIARQLNRSCKPNRVLVVNADDDNHQYFKNVVNTDVHIKHFSLQQVKPYKTTQDGISLTWNNTQINSPVKGVYNIENITASCTITSLYGVSSKTIKTAVANYTGADGRGEEIDGGQPFTVVIDYAHTPDALKKLYKTYTSKNTTLISVFGSAGGGRDTWKRSEMGSIADTYCDRIYLTTEDPYNEDPKQIAKEILTGISSTETEIIIDRRNAIHAALTYAYNSSDPENTVVLISGIGAQTTMSIKNNTIPWSDITATKEILTEIQPTP